MIEAPRRETHTYQAAKGKRTLREIAHPLSAEILVADMSGELPPAAVQAVHDHLARCATCRARALKLSGPYSALSTLGAVPVAFVPDLRRPVRERWAKAHALLRVARTVRLLGGGGLAGAAALVAIVLVSTLFVVTNAFQAPIILTRSSNAVIGAPPAGGPGLLYAETNKVMNVQAGNGAAWTVAEVIAVDKPSANVVLSLPQTAQRLHVGTPGEFPVAVALAPGAQIVYQVTAPQRGRQALLAFDAHTGELKFVTVLTLPDGRALPTGFLARSLAIAPDGQHLYITISGAPTALGGPEILILDHQGAVLAGVDTPKLDVVVHQPPPPAALPGIAAPSVGPAFTTTGLLQSAANGALTISADGRWLFDAVTLDRGSTPVAVVIRRIAAATGMTTQSVALPGDFSLSAMAGSAKTATPLLYLVRVGGDGMAYIFDVSGTGLVVRSEIPLGGLGAPALATITGTVSISPTADGALAYIGADTSVAGTQLSSHDLWLINGVTSTVASHRIECLAAGQALANGSTGKRGLVFVMRGSQIILLPPDLALRTSPPIWLRLGDGLPLIRLIATTNG